LSLYHLTVLVEGHWQQLVAAARRSRGAQRDAVLAALRETLRSAVLGQAVAALSTYLEGEAAYDDLGVVWQVSLLPHHTNDAHITLGLDDPDQVLLLDALIPEQDESVDEDAYPVPKDVLWPGRDLVCSVTTNGTLHVGVSDDMFARAEADATAFGVVDVVVRRTMLDHVMDDVWEERDDTQKLVHLVRMVLTFVQFAPQQPLPLDLLFDCLTLDEDDEHAEDDAQQALALLTQQGPVLLDDEAGTVLVPAGLHAAVMEFVNAVGPSFQQALLTFEQSLRATIDRELATSMVIAWRYNQFEEIRLLLPHMQHRATTAILRASPGALNMVVALLSPLLAQDSVGGNPLRRSDSGDDRYRSGRACSGWRTLC
jgi:hypothetical protein